MPFGVLEDYTLSCVPGTVSLTDTNQGKPTLRLYPTMTDSNLVEEGHGNLKKVGDITLVPQPGDDPDDPLNW